jgi:internalin A
MPTPNEASQEAEKMIEEAKRGKEEELNLQNLGLTAFPESIVQLTQLQTLSLNNNKLTGLPDSIGQLTQLQTLSLDYNQLTGLPDSIGQLTQLQLLYINDNKLTVLPESIGQLTQLQSLYIDDNKLTVLPESIGQLTQLQSLNINRNQLTALPDCIGRLTQLQHLFLNSNQLTALPDSIGKLAQLKELFIDDNELTVLPDTIGQLIQLIVLSLSLNKLIGLPDSIAILTHLEWLYLDNNQLIALPDSLAKMLSLPVLFLHGNQSLQLPPEVLGPTWEEARDSNEKEEPADPKTILAYYWQIRSQERRSLNEAKLLLVGQGGVGKTSLVRYLVENKRCQKDEPATEGIGRVPWELKIKHPEKRAKQEVTLNVWDFGGQEIMHATHQFFLTRRSLYLLVLDARTTEAENNLYYWLKVIQSFGGDAPVLVVVNKDEGGVALELNETRLTKDFAPNLKGFYRVSCCSGKGIPELRKAIDREVGQLPHVFDELPASYFKVKAQIGAWAEQKKCYITFESYQKLCIASGVTDETNQHQLLRFLHDLGIALNFDDPDSPFKLHDTNVLDPEWVTDAVYRIITSPSLKEAGGVLLREKLAELLKNKTRFPESQHEFIIEMMRKFELCFDFPDSSGNRFLVPERLEKKEPDVGWDQGDPLNFEVKYNVLPPGLICRFIVKMHTYLKPDTPTYWRDGAVLYVYGNRCLLRGSVEDRRIYIQIQGPMESRREALALVREKLTDIHQSIKGLLATELVPVPKQRKVTVEYATLVKMLHNKIDNFFPEGADKPESATELITLVDTEQRLNKEMKGLVTFIGKEHIAIHSQAIASLWEKGIIGKHPELDRQEQLEQIDFGIITMKEEEFTAVEKRFEPVELVRLEKRQYLHSRVQTPNGIRNVLIARCLEQGQSDAAQCANDMISDVNPRWILLVGIAGAYPAEEFTLGDVLLASRVYDFAVTAALEGREPEQSTGGGPVHPEVSRLLQVIPSREVGKQLGEWNGPTMIAMPKPALKIPTKLSDPPYYGPEKWMKDVRRGLKANFPAKQDPRSPKYRVVPVATGNTLVKNTKVAVEWRKVARIVAHIEMELGGVYAVAHQANKPVLSVRGISDVIGYRRSTAWTDYACQTAAAFTRALIGSGLIPTRN